MLTFFAQDSGTHNLVYANADLSKATQAREPIAFCDHWKAVSGADPHLLVMDQKVTTHKVLGELDARGIKFLTLRMRSPSLVRHINSLTPTDFATITLDRPGPYNKPQVHEDAAVALSDYPGTVRQLIVTGLGHQAPTVIITNHDQASRKALIAHYARRMTIEQRLAEIIRAFCADACSAPSTSTSTSTSCSPSWPKPSWPPSAPACPATTPSPPTPCSAASSRPRARSSPPTR